MIQLGEYLISNINTIKVFLFSVLKVEVNVNESAASIIVHSVPWKVLTVFEQQKLSGKKLVCKINN